MKIERQIKRILAGLLLKVERIAKRRLSPDEELLPRKRRLAASQNKPVTDLSDYYFENGFRKVYPYYYNWTAMAKGRWVGRTIEDIYTREFCRTSFDYDVRRLIEMGRITVNNEPTTPSYVVRDGDRVSNFVHRHEAPVLDLPVKIHAETKDYVVVDKPPSLPVHPCGRYCLNTVTSILAKERGLRGLRLVHRLDRATSGLLLLAKNQDAARRAERLIHSRQVQKRYVCLVDGVLDRELRVQLPVKVISYKHGLCRVARSPDEEGSKEAETLFRPLNGRSNVVECVPKTGRMHQIRVHLQASGIPIVNDHLYNNKYVWGERNGAGGNYDGLSDEEIVKRFAGQHFYKNCIKGIVRPREPVDSKREAYDADCFQCAHEFEEPDPKQQIVYLHACCYTFPGVDSDGNTLHFQVPLPDWAQTD